MLVEKRAQMVEAEHMVLSGHRSIVNQVRYNYDHGVIASSGVEKIIKVIVLLYYLKTKTVSEMQKSF